MFGSMDRLYLLSIFADDKAIFLPYFHPFLPFHLGDKTQNKKKCFRAQELHKVMVLHYQGSLHIICLRRHCICMVQFKKRLWEGKRKSSSLLAGNASFGDSLQNLDQKFARRYRKKSVRKCIKVRVVFADIIILLSWSSCKVLILYFICLFVCL